MQQSDSGRPQRTVVRPGRLQDYEVSDLPYRGTAASLQPGLELTPPREGTTYGEDEDERLGALMSHNALFSAAADTPARPAARPRTAAGADQTPRSADRAAFEAAKNEYERLLGLLKSQQKGEQLSAWDAEHPPAGPVQPGRQHRWQGQQQSCDPLDAAEREVHELQQLLLERERAKQLQELQQQKSDLLQRLQAYESPPQPNLRAQQQGSSAAAQQAAASTQMADEDRMRRQLASQLQLQRADPSLAVPADRVPDMTNSNVAQLQPAAHAAAKALLEQEAAAGAHGLGPLPAGEPGARLVAGSGVTDVAKQRQVLAAVDSLGSSYRSSCCVGAYGRRGQPSPAVPYTPQAYANYSRQHLTEANVYVDASGKQHLQLHADKFVTDPGKLAKIMATSHQFSAAQRACLRAMAEAGLITTETLPQWEVFWCA